MDIWVIKDIPEWDEKRNYCYHLRYKAFRYGRIMIPYHTTSDDHKLGRTTLSSTNQVTPHSSLYCLSVLKQNAQKWRDRIRCCSKYLIYARGFSANSVRGITHHVSLTSRSSIFKATKVEDFVRFWKNAELSISLTNFQSSGWTIEVELQLKVAAVSFWKSIKVMELSWLEFRLGFK